jgi:hypothetical protein
MDNNRNLPSTVYHTDGTITHNAKTKQPYSQVAGIKHFKKKVKGYKFTNKLILAGSDTKLLK